MCCVQFFGHCDFVDVDLVSRIIVSGAFLPHFLGRISKFGLWVHLGMAK